MKQLKTFVEWMDEEQVEAEATVSLRDNVLTVKNDAGEFEVELTDEQVTEVSEKLQAMAGGEEDLNVSADDEVTLDDDPKDEEDEIAPSVGGVGRLSGMP